jgi:hypothetical protein
MEEERLQNSVKYDCSMRIIEILCDEVREITFH